MNPDGAELTSMASSDRDGAGVGAETGGNPCGVGGADCDVLLLKVKTGAVADGCGMVPKLD